MIWLGKPLDIGYLLKPFGFMAIGPPFGRAWWFFALLGAILSFLMFID